MSRNAPYSTLLVGSLGAILHLIPFWSTSAQPFTPAPTPPAPGLGLSLTRETTASRARVVIVHDPRATEAFEPRSERVAAMVHQAVTNWTRLGSVAEAWRNIVSTQDIVGLKVYSAPGPNSGTRPSVVAGVIEGLLEAGLSPRNIIVWDEERADLRRAGFYEMNKRFGVRVEGGGASGYDEETFYETPLIGQLVWGDLEFGRKGEGIGRKSFVSLLVSHQITRIINIPPLLNHNSAGVSGNLYSLAMGSVDNTHRFEMDAARLATAVPEIYALPSLSDRVAFNVVDALICQYQGESRGLLHYSKALNEIRVSNDPVALDVLSLLELNRQREMMNMTPVARRNELYQNAALLELGVSNPAEISIERFEVPRP